MIIVSSKDILQELIQNYKKNKKKITLIPTMGNLHLGHLELMKHAPKNTIKIVTIYVNKLQFDNTSDFMNYPKTYDLDIAKCRELNIDLLFIPDGELSKTFKACKNIRLPKFTNYLCGKSRKGHFLGVYSIVRYFLDVIKPDYACFGLKDFQQLLLIKFIRDKYFKDLKIIEVVTKRNNRGIALSSRLNRLSDDEMLNAEKIYSCLNQLKLNIKNDMKFHDLKPIVTKELESSLIKVEYLEHRFNDTLEICNDHYLNSSIFIACIIGRVRLIDNIQI
jgi:pantoate--beta-alanine ligase